MLTSFVIYNMTRNNVFSSEKAKREIDFKARNLEETVKDMIAWLHRENRICITVDAAKRLLQRPLLTEVLPSQAA